MFGAYSGIHPKRNPLPFKHQLGFTLVEIMMSVILIAISTALAAPSYRTMVEKRQLTNTAEQIAAFVNSVQGISSRSNQMVTVSFDRNDSDDWCIGATLGPDACDCGETNTGDSDFCEIDSLPYVLNESINEGAEMINSIEGNGADFSFDPIRGMFADMNDYMTVEMHSRSQDFKLDLMVNPTGRVVLCSHDSSHAVPGYAVCDQEEES